LQYLARKEGRSIGQIIETLLLREERHRVFEELSEDFRRLRSDPVASAEYDAEFAAWDATNLDGFADLPYEEPAADTKPTWTAERVILRRYCRTPVSRALSHRRTSSRRMLMI
jgi:hypothetical protein